MARTPGWAETAAALCAALLAGACSGEPAPETGSVAAPLAEPVDPERAAQVTGVVRVEGTPLPPEPINMRADPYCAQENPDATSQPVAADAEGRLQHVFVYVKDGLGNVRYAAPSTPVVLNQRGCTYEPRVFGVQVGQPLELLNGDDTLHNVNAVARINREFNRGQANLGDRHTHVFSTVEVMVPIKCDVHRWMQAWAGVLDHPFHDTSGADGRFRLDGLPPGTYTIEAWHEVLGTQTQTVTIGEAETRDIAFTFGL